MSRSMSQLTPVSAPQCTGRTRQVQALRATSLMVKALDAEQQRHAQRLEMVHRMAGALRQLDAYMPAVQEAGIDILADELNCWSGSALYVRSPALNPQRNAILEQVLRAAGMLETERFQNGDGSYCVELIRGQLCVRLTVDAHRLQQGSTAAQSAA